MSPTVLRYKAYRFFFFSREEDRMHVHVQGPDGEAKFWLEPKVALAKAEGLKAKALKDIERQVLANAEILKKAWKEHRA
jgi:hypothetical protein